MHLLHVVNLFSLKLIISRHTHTHDRQFSVSNRWRQAAGFYFSLLVQRLRAGILTANQQRFFYSFIFHSLKMLKLNWFKFHVSFLGSYFDRNRQVAFSVFKLYFSLFSFRPFLVPRGSLAKNKMSGFFPDMNSNAEKGEKMACLLQHAVKWEAS